MRKHWKLIFHLSLCVSCSLWAQGIGLNLNKSFELLQVFYSGCAAGTENPSPVNESFENQIFTLVNAERSQRGLPPYTRLDKLDRAARYHTTDMGVEDYFDHDTYDRVNGQLVKQCNWDVRVKNFYVDTWYGGAENIAAGATTPEQAMNLWMSSPSHRDNILSTFYNEIGIGYYYNTSSTYHHYWTVDFTKGVPLSVELFSFEIKQEGKDICITWTTESESNNLGYEVQYKRGGEYLTLEFIHGHGTTSMPHIYEYRVKNVSPGYHTFRLKQIDYDGSYMFIGEKTLYIPFSEPCYVSEIYPNPMNGTAQFQLTSEETLPIKIELYDITGRLQKIIFSGYSSAGQLLQFNIDLANLSGGIYFLRIAAASWSITRRLVYIK